jgi:hypothetical protein
MFTASTCCLPSRVWALILLPSISSLTSAQKDNGNECSCFRTNGSSAGYFTSHRFLDYRHVSSASPEVPTLISNITNATNALATSDFFSNEAWTNDWTTQNWNNSDDVASFEASVLRVNSPSNVYMGTCPIPHFPCQNTNTTPPQRKATTATPPTQPTSPSEPPASPPSNRPPKSTPSKRTTTSSPPASTLV